MFPDTSSPDFLVIGHATRDVHIDETFSPGGTVTFAAHCAAALGLVTGVVTCADETWYATLTDHLPSVMFQIHPSPRTTTFANRYQEGFRTQHLYARGETLPLVAVPSAWLAAPIVLFGPVAQELEPDFITSFPHPPGSIRAATPQGWLRRWDTAGRVWPVPWHDAEALLPHLDVLILSHDDLLPFADDDRDEADRLLARWSTFVPLLVATDGRHGADLYQSGTVTHFSAYPVQEIDPTGAGDVFAAAFLVHFYRHRSPHAAVEFANCVASFSIEQVGLGGIPTEDIIARRLRTSRY